MSYNPLTWTEYREDRLRHLWGRGVPVKLIAYELGISTNSVVGKAYRIGLSRRRNKFSKIKNSS